MTEKQEIEIPILYEDQDVVVINKPAGVVVNRSQTYAGYTVQDWIEEYEKQWSRGEENIDTAQSSDTEESIILGDPQELFLERSGIVHRLDKETSGIMLIAKNPAALIAYMTQFKKRTVTKTYLTLVHGKVSPADGIIDLPIGRNSGNRLQFAVREGGKESRTAYHVLQFYPHIDVDKIISSREDSFAKSTEKRTGLSPNFKRATKIYQGFSLIEVTPRTGRTHQIRVHFAHMKHPLVGDKLYSGNKRRVIDQYWCSRHFLHAYSLTFYNIRTKTEQKVSATLPLDLETALSFLS